MRPMSSRGRFGMPPIRSVAAKLAIALVMGSIVAGLLERTTGLMLYLVPGQVFGGAVWQPFTWLLLENDPLGILFGALIIWSIGGALEQTWGARRLLWVTFTITFTSGVLTLLLSLLIPVMQVGLFAGGMVVTGSLWVGYGLLFGKTPMNFWGIPVTGNTLAAIGVLFVVINAVFGSPLLVIPEVMGILMVAAYVKLGSPRVFLLRYQSWRLQRQLKQRGKHLRVIGGDRNMPGGSDRYLH